MAKKPVVEAPKFPEVGFFKDQKDLQKHYKKLSMDELQEWLDLEGLTYTATDSEPIQRMRMCMAILYKHFPKETTGKKKTSKYAAYTLEQLVQLAADNDCVFEVCDDEKILRMRAIMALRAHKVLE